MTEPTDPEALDDADALAHYRLAAAVAGMDLPELRLPATRHVVVGRHRLHYLDWGPGGAPTMVFLHGGGLTAHTWDLVCLGLGREHHCVALDQRGHGDSEWSPEMDYGPEAHLRDITGFIDHLGLERFVLVGQSMGALNGFTYARRHAERLLGLVLVDAGPDVHVEGAARIIEFVESSAEGRSMDELVQKALAFNPRRDPRLLRQSLRHSFRRLPDGRWVRKQDRRHWVDVDVAELTARARQQFREPGRVTCPTLVVRGALSDVFHDADADRFARTLPAGRWVRVEDAGHTVQGDNPRGLVEALLRFVAELTQR